MSTPIKVMTFNMRISTPVDGDNWFRNRKPKIAEVIRRENPDIIGFQEVTDKMREFMRDALKDEYTFIGCGSYKDYNGPGNPIAFKRDVFELIELETKWLSPNPEIPGTRYEDADQSKYPRYYLKARLRVIATGETIWYINTHTDHVGVKVRALETTQLLKVMQGIADEPVILMGDLNAKPEEESIQILSSDASTGIVDVTAHIPHSFHWWGQLNPRIKIDYIFSNLPCAESHAVEDNPDDGVYISDHNPVVATLKLPSESNE